MHIEEKEPLEKFEKKVKVSSEKEQLKSENELNI